MFLFLVIMFFIKSDTKPPATFDGGMPVTLQNSSLLAWYSFRVKYDLFILRTSGHTTFSQTILRFSVDDACLPFLLIICCSPVPSAGLSRCGLFSNSIEVHLNCRVYNL